LVTLTAICRYFRKIQNLQLLPAKRLSDAFASRAERFFSHRSVEMAGMKMSRKINISVFLSFVFLSLQRKTQDDQK
jgi:hypothetical protein